MSENPFLDPASENVWQGNPPQMQSWSGMSAASMVVISVASYFVP